jgi:A/G-specific adenine glycosylase
VKQGWAYWERFMQQWPTVEALAAATEDDVLLAWQGLGYYSRARHLHAAARQVVVLGGFPRTIEGLRRLKGVGDYTAAAIGSIAFDLPAAVVDGNVYRVLSRHFGIATPINTTEGKKEFALLAQELLPPGEASAYNQAIMDFGATQCTPQSAECDRCPLLATCVAASQGTVGELPVKLRTLKIQERHLCYVYVRCQGQTAIHRRGEGDIWQGLWEPWLVETPPEGAVALRMNVKHALTHRRLLADFYLLETTVRPTLPPDYIWIAEDDLHRYGVPRLVERLLEEVR